MIHTANIKSDMPTTGQVPVRVAAAMTTGKRLGATAVKIIHGYGSTGQGGRLRSAVRHDLAQRKRKGLIRDYIPGENFSIFNEAVLRAFALCPALRRDADLDRQNNGVTVIIL